MIDTEILEEFASEAKELLDEMEESLMRLEKEGPSSELLNNVFRAAHCIKGSAEYIGLERSGAFTHAMENLLDRLREGRVELTPRIIDFLFRSKDLVARLVDEVTEAREERSDISDMMRELEALMEGREPEVPAGEEPEEPLSAPEIPEEEVGKVEVGGVEELPEPDREEVTEPVVEEPTPDELPPVTTTDMETAMRVDTNELEDYAHELDEIAGKKTPTVELETPDDLARVDTTETTEDLSGAAGVEGEEERKEEPEPVAKEDIPEEEPVSFPDGEPTVDIRVPTPIEELEAGATLEETIPHVLNMGLYIDDLEDGLNFEDMRSALMGTIANLKDSLEFIGIHDGVAVLEEMETLLESCDKIDGRLSADTIAKLRALLDNLHGFYPPETFPREEPTLPEPEVTPTEEPSPMPIPFADELLHIAGVDSQRIQALYDAGFTSREMLAEATVEKLEAVPGIDRSMAEAIHQAFRPVPKKPKEAPRTEPGERSLLSDIDDELLQEFEGMFRDEVPDVPPVPEEERIVLDGELSEHLGVVGEETDREIIEIFVSYAWEVVDRILPVAGKARDGAAERSDLEACAEAIKSIRASSTYMDYRKLAAFLEDWYERTLWAAEVVDTLTAEDLSFIDDKLGEFQDFLRQLEASIKLEALVAEPTPVETVEPKEAPPAVEPIPTPTGPEIREEVKSPTPAAPQPALTPTGEHAVPDTTEVREARTEKPADNQSAVKHKEPTLPPEPAPTTPVVRTMRVEAAKVDILLNQVGELVVNRSYVEQLSLELKNFQREIAAMKELGKREIQALKDLTLRVGEASTSLGRTATDLQEGVMKLRMLPVGQLFNRMPRLIRDLSRRVGKVVELQIKGGDTEVDKRVIEQIYNPLVHLIRNAVDHGIEDPHTRVARGKKQEGTILLSAYSQGNQVVIDVEDDGRGIDLDEVKSKAVEMGLIDAKDRLTSPQEIYNLLFVPGFSTSKRVTRTSGRGVGMDVVKKDVEKINGQIEIDSVMGKGTRISIKIPLTLAIIQTLLIRFGRHILAIPLTSVREIIQVARHEFSTIEGFEVIKLRDETIPVLRINEVFNMSNSHVPGTEKYIVLATAGMKTMGFPVEDLVGEQDVVIKPLAEHVWKAKGLAGSTILGDGTIALVLDVAELVEDVILRYRQLAQAGRRVDAG